MSMFGDVAVKAEFENFLKFLDSIKDDAPDNQLVKIRKKIEKTIQAADSGYL